jgi:hypothetical protein
MGAMKYSAAMPISASSAHWGWRASHHAGSAASAALDRSVAFHHTGTDESGETPLSVSRVGDPEIVAYAAPLEQEGQSSVLD